MTGETILWKEWQRVSPPPGWQDPWETSGMDSLKLQGRVVGSVLSFHQQHFTFFPWTNLDYPEDRNWLFLFHEEQGGISPKEYSLKDNRKKKCSRILIMTTFTSVQHTGCTYVNTFKPPMDQMKFLLLFSPTDAETENGRCRGTFSNQHSRRKWSWDLNQVLVGHQH